MKKSLLVVALCVFTTALKAASLTLSPSIVNVDQVGSTVPVIVHAAELNNLHSAELTLRLPPGVELVPESLSAGPFMESGGGQTVVYQEVGSGGFTLSQALLGTQNDVSGTGVLASFSLHLSQIPLNPIQVAMTSVTLKESSGDEVAGVQLPSLTITHEAIPTLTLRSSVTRIQTVGQTANVEIHASNIRDLHSYALELIYFTNALTYVASTEGPFMTGAGASTHFHSALIHNAVEISGAILGTDRDVSGAGLLATVSFESKSLEDLPLTLSLNNFSLIDTHAVNWGGLVVAETLTLLTSEQDADSDQLLDSWELQHFGSINDPRAQAAADPDGDGQNNLFEYIAGLNPTDPTSRFNVEIKPKSDAPKGVMLSYGPIAAGRNYEIQYTENFSAWHGVSPSSSVENSGVRESFLTNTNAVRFYRLRVILP